MGVDRLILPEGIRGPDLAFEDSVKIADAGFEKIGHGAILLCIHEGVLKILLAEHTRRPIDGVSGGALGTINETIKFVIGDRGMLRPESSEEAFYRSVEEETGIKPDQLLQNRLRFHPELDKRYFRLLWPMQHYPDEHTLTATFALGTIAFCDHFYTDDLNVDTGEINRVSWTPFRVVTEEVKDGKLRKYRPGIGEVLSSIKDAFIEDGYSKYNLDSVLVEQSDVPNKPESICDTRFTDEDSMESLRDYWVSKGIQPFKLPSGLWVASEQDVASGRLQ